MLRTAKRVMEVQDWQETLRWILYKRELETSPRPQRWSVAGQCGSLGPLARSPSLTTKHYIAVGALRAQTRAELRRQQPYSAPERGGQRLTPEPSQQAPPV